MIVGLDIGTKLIKVVALGGSRRRPRLLRFAVREVPEGGPEALAAALLDLFREERLPHDRVFTSLRTQDVVIREITVPFVQEDAIRKTIKFEAETAFHGASIENMVVDFSLISTGAEKSRVLVVGAQKKTVAGVLSLLNSAGIDPVGIGLDLGALYNTAAWCGVLPAKEAAILIDVGTSSARLVVVEDGRIRAARAIRLQAVSLPAVPEGQAKDEPSEEKEVATPAQDDQAAKAVARVSSEVARTLIGCRLRRPLAGVWATGGGPARAAICRGVAERLSVESHDLPLADRLGAETDGPAELGVAAIGSALVGLGVDTAQINFRQEEFRFQRAFERARKGIATAVSVLFLALFLLCWSLRRDTRETEVRIRLSQNSQRALIGILFPDEDRPFRDAWSIIEKRKNELEKRFQGKDTEIRSSLHDFRVVSQALVASKAKLKFRQLRLRQDSSRLEGEADSSEDVYRFREELEKTATMNVASPNINNLEDGGVKFSIDIKHVSE